MDAVCHDVHARMRQLEALYRERAREGSGDAIDADADSLEAIKLARDERHAGRRVEQHGDRRDRQKQEQRNDDENASAH